MFPAKKDKTMSARKLFKNFALLPLKNGDHNIALPKAG
jgi:hypothetical protein